MVKKNMSLVEIADMITGLSPNEMSTLGKIVMAKQRMVQPMPPGGVSNVPGPMGSPPTGMAGRPPQQLPPQMVQQQPRRPMPPTARDAVVPGLLR
tara:strand:- start:351 stop:635 length:285 start_codon:yes stop_codon:yes gene_type:complete